MSIQDEPLDINGILSSSSQEKESPTSSLLGKRSADEDTVSEIKACAWTAGSLSPKSLTDPLGLSSTRLDVGPRFSSAFRPPPELFYSLSGPVSGCSSTTKPAFNYPPHFYQHAGPKILPGPPQNFSPIGPRAFLPRPPPPPPPSVKPYPPAPSRLPPPPPDYYMPPLYQPVPFYPPYSPGVSSRFPPHVYPHVNPCFIHPHYRHMDSQPPHLAPYSPIQPHYLPAQPPHAKNQSQIKHKSLAKMHRLGWTLDSSDSSQEEIDMSATIRQVARSLGAVGSGFDQTDVITQLVAGWAGERVHRVVIYGSHVIQTDIRGSDIDCLVLVRREGSEGEAVDLLYEMKAFLKRERPGCEAEVVESANPLLKLCLSNQNFDIALGVAESPEEIDVEDPELGTKQVFKDLEPAVKLLVNGARNMHAIVRALKHKEDTTENKRHERRLENFKDLLRIVKLWAKRNHVGSNKMGFLGGISLSLLAAKLCQLFPNKSLSRLLEKFFWIYGKRWAFPTHHLHLTAVTSPQDFLADRSKIVSITPCDPQLNSSYTVYESSFALIRSLLAAAHTTLNNIMNERPEIGPATESRDQMLRDFLTVALSPAKPGVVLAGFSHIARIRVEVKEESINQMEGFLESRIRKLAHLTENAGKCAAVVLGAVFSDPEKPGSVFLMGIGEKKGPKMETKPTEELVQKAMEEYKVKHVKGYKIKGRDALELIEEQVVVVTCEVMESCKYSDAGLSISC